MKATMNGSRRQAAVVALSVLCVALAGVRTAAEPPAKALPPAKQAELAAAGIGSWAPGQHQGTGPVFSRLGQGVAAPGPAVRDTATMQYDNGMLTALPTAFGAIFGNRFSLGIAGVSLDTITLNSFSFFFMEDSLPDTGLFLQPADPLNPTSISARASVNVTGLMNSGPNFSMPVLNVVPQAALGTTGMFNDTFFLGGWCLNTATMFPINNEVIGLDTNLTQVKGFTASSGVGAVAFSAQPFNAILRANVTSPNLVPVELMAFEVDGSDGP